jgi:hypothetical protein
MFGDSGMDALISTASPTAPITISPGDSPGNLNIVTMGNTLDQSTQEVGTAAAALPSDIYNGFSSLIPSAGTLLGGSFIVIIILILVLLIIGKVETL